MAFTTQTFVFVFFPICILVYYLSLLMQTKGILSKVLTKYRVHDFVLIGISSCFYLWACYDDLYRFLLYILAIYLLGNVIEKIRKKDYWIIAEHKHTSENKKYISLALPIFFFAITFVLLILIHFKYNVLVPKYGTIFLKMSLLPNLL